MTAAPAMRAAVVTTEDNASPANDGKTSLLEALTNVQNNETISFNIPGDGPHYIVTPVAGYPLITKSGVTIDGYTQPGSAPNTAAPDQPKNTKLKIVIDSRTDVPAERRTVLTGYSGFGDEESCVLGFLDAPHASIRGLSFLGVVGGKNASDPGVYCIAFVEGCTDAKVQGCWFGLDPSKISWKPGADGTVSGVAGAAAAVAAFAGGNEATNLTFGTDGDGAGDRGEGNLAMAQYLAVALTATESKVAGNWFNMFPDGSFLNLETWTGLRLSAVENGDGLNMRIGTNGDGVSDAEEGNWFGPINYSEFLEFWKASGTAATGVVLAGNHIGMSLDGAPAFSSPGSNLAYMKGNGSIRIGTDGNGTADRAEANHLYGVASASQPFLGIKNTIQVSLRGNELMACGGPVPYNFSLIKTQDSNPTLMYQDFLTPPANPEDPWDDTVKFNAASTAGSVSGTYPVQLDWVSKPVIDLYIADATGLALPEGPSVQGRYWLGAFDTASAANQDATLGKFKFDTTALALTPSELALLTATATYKLPDDIFATLNFSETLQPYTIPPALGGVTFAPATQAGHYTLSWTGGIGPFQVVSSSSLTGPWAPLSTVSAQTTEITPSFTTEPRKFYRVREGASPR